MKLSPTKCAFKKIAKLLTTGRKRDVDLIGLERFHVRKKGPHLYDGGLFGLLIDVISV
jgi:hypothetical protein